MESNILKIQQLNDVFRKTFTGKNFNRQAAKFNINLLRGDTASASQ